MVDVAKAAGVSRTTASFVLNGRDVAIPEDTRRRVLDAAAQMGYYPNASAVALATGRTRRLGIVVNQPESFYTHDGYFERVLYGVTSRASQHDYNLLLHTAHYRGWRPLLDSIQGGAADGTLLIGRFAQDALTHALLETAHPTVCVSYNIAHTACHSIDCDNEMGGYVAARHLIGLGHAHIAFFYPGDGVSWGQERKAGALRALREAGQPESNLLDFPWAEVKLPDSELSARWIKEASEFVCGSRPRPSAAIFCDEARARTFVERMPEVGIRVPEDLAVVCFNSTEISERARPPLTSVWQPLEQIGACAVDQLIKLIETGRTERLIHRFPVRLDVRASCGAPGDQAVVSVPIEMETSSAI
jgi:DNA-binding LacI/PurR family transcriptional regulator